MLFSLIFSHIAPPSSLKLINENGRLYLMFDKYKFGWISTIRNSKRMVWRCTRTDKNVKKNRCNSILHTKLDDLKLDIRKLDSRKLNNEPPPEILEMVNVIHSCCSPTKQKVAKEKKRK